MTKLTRKGFCQAAYPVLLCLLAVSMTTSVFAANLIWTLLAVNWVVEWNWRERFADFRHNYLLHAFLALIAVYAAGLIWTSNTDSGLRVLRENLPMLLVPLVILTSHPLSPRHRQEVGLAHVATVLVVSIIGIVRYLTLPDLPYRQIVPYISHIRFGLNICFDLVLLIYAATHFRKAWLWLVNGLLSLWLIFFLLLIHAYTAFIILGVMMLVLLACYSNRLTRKVRLGAWSAVILVLLSVIGITAYYAKQYFTPQPTLGEPAGIAPDAVNPCSSSSSSVLCTVNGEPYESTDDGPIENGHYTFRYVCHSEMERQWGRISNRPYDQPDANGYDVFHCLVRYLNCLGVTKDSLGMTHLTPTDIAAIERGVANPVYEQPGLRKMFYVIFYEYENYYFYRNIRGFTMLQRFELWGNAWQIFCEHPFFGTGTGDILDQCHALLHKNDSPLADTTLDTHCQYLHFLVGFGLIGFLIIVFFFARAIVKQHLCRNILFGAFLCIVLISFLSEDTLCTLAGMLFFAMGCCLLPQTLPLSADQDSAPTGS